MKKSLLFVALTFISMSHSFAKDSAQLFKKAQKEESKVLSLEEKVDKEKAEANEAMDNGHKGTAAKHARKAAKTARIANKYEKREKVLDKKAQKMLNHETR